MKPQRLQTVLENMEKLDIPQLLVSSTAGVYYLTGQWIEPYERMLALYIHRDGKCVFFVNRMFAAQPSEGAKTVEYDDTMDPVALLAETVEPGRLGVDKTWPSRFLIGLMAKRKDVTPVQGSEPVDRARLFKDAEEIAALRAASKINDQVMERTVARLKAGISETELFGAVSGEYESFGAVEAGGAYIVCFGPGGAEPHHEPGQTRLKAQDSVLMDISKPIGRYYCDMTRTVFYGGATDEQKRVYEAVHKANLAGIEKVKPGVPMCEIDRAARSVIEQAGYGEYFTHRTGHGLGIEVHEPPDVSLTDTQIALPGMVFSIEPGVYLPGKFGVRVEDLVCVTESGVEVLNQYTKELQIVAE